MGGRHISTRWWDGGGGYCNRRTLSYEWRDEGSSFRSGQNHSQITPNRFQPVCPKEELHRWLLGDLQCLTVSVLWWPYYRIIFPMQHCPTNHFYYIELSCCRQPPLQCPHSPSPPGCLYGLYLGFGATTGANFLGGCCVDTEMLGVPKEWVVSIRADTWPRGSAVLFGGSQDGWDIVESRSKKKQTVAFKETQKWEQYSSLHYCFYLIHT